MPCKIQKPFKDVIYKLMLILSFLFLLQIYLYMQSRVMLIIFDFIIVSIFTTNTKIFYQLTDCRIKIRATANKKTFVSKIPSHIQ